MHLRYAIRVVPFALILLASNGFAEAFENSVFRAGFEAKPSLVIDASAGDVSVNYFVDNARFIQIVQYQGSEINLADALDDQAKESVFRTKLDAYKQMFGAENTSAKAITVQGYKGREFVCQSAKRGAMYTRTIIAKHQLFQVILMFKPGQKADPAQAKSFFDSFKILKESESKTDKFNIIKDKGKRFSGLALPNVKAFRHKLKGSDEKVEWYVSQKMKQLFGIYVYEYPGKAGDDIIDFTAARNTARNAGSKLGVKFTEVSIKKDKTPWRDQAYRSRDGKYELGLKIVVVRDRVFIAMAGGPAADSGSDEQQEYLSRFKVLVK